MSNDQEVPGWLFESQNNLPCQEEHIQRLGTSPANEERWQVALMNHAWGAEPPALLHEPLNLRNCDPESWTCVIPGFTDYDGKTNDPKDDLVKKRAGSQSRQRSGGESKRQLKHVLQDDDKAVQGQEESLAFACPFLRRDPCRYEDCQGFKLKRIRDVKQHIRRRHRSYQCPVCFCGFSSQRAQDEHIRARCCKLRDSTTPPEYQSILKLELVRPADRSLSPPDQWYSLWKTLFPGITEPRSPFVGTMLDEGLETVHTLWEECSGEVVEAQMESLRKRKGEKLDADEIAKMMHEMLDRIGHLAKQKRTASKTPERQDSFGSVSPVSTWSGLARYDEIVPCTRSSSGMSLYQENLGEEAVDVAPYANNELFQPFMDDSTCSFELWSENMFTADGYSITPDTVYPTLY